MSDRGPRPPPQSGSKRANMMVALAKDGKPRRPPLVLSQSKPPPLVTFKREKKRAVGPEEEDGLQFSLFSSMARTPKKQRTVEQTTLPAPSTQTRAVPDTGRGADQPPPRQRSQLTYTQATDCYNSGASKQRLREQRMSTEAEHRRHRLQPMGGWGRRGVASCLPAGMRNLGNTCYLNAVLQVLLSLPSFVADLKQGRQQLQAAGQPLDAGGVYSAVLDCVAARDNTSNSGRGYISPANLKRALDAATSAFQGAFQQDAHELFCGLLDSLQTEVLAREAARLGRTRIRVSETSDPAARNFGFAVEHRLACSGCGHVSSLVEQYTHLSLELPEAQPGGSALVSSVWQLLRDYFKEEEVEKSCEECGGSNLPHGLRHSIRRLPRVLCLHMKRFKVSWHEQQKRPVCQKLHTSVEMPETVQLGSYLAVAAQPPLPGGQLQLHAPGKENEQQHVNTAPNSQEAGPASQEATPLEVYPKTRPGSQNHGDISGGGISGGNRITAVASHALVHSTPRPGAAAATPFLKRRLPGTPGAGAVFRPLRSVCEAAAEEEEDADLRQALALSLLEGGQPQQPQPQPQPPQQQQQQQQGRQQQEQQTGAEESGLGTSLPQAAPDSSPRLAPHAAKASLLPEQDIAASKAGSGAGSRLQDQWFMGLGSASKQQQDGGGGGCNGGTAAAEGEDEELQRAIQLSMLHAAQQQQASAEKAGRGSGGSPPAFAYQSPAVPAAAAAEAEADGAVTPAAGLAALGGAAAGAAAAEEPRSQDTQLQKAIQLSLLDCGNGRGDSGGGTSAAAGAAGVGGQQRRLRHQRHQQQCSGPDPVLLHALLEAVEDPGGSPVAADISGGAAAGVTRQGLLVPAHESDLLLPAPAPAPAASPAAAAVSEAAILAAAAARDSEFTETIDLISSQPTINGDAEAPLAAQAAAVAPAAAAAVYVHAEVVEDEPLLCTEEINPKGAAGAAGAAVRTTAAAAQYRLHGVVSHEGPAASCGHFTSDVLDAASLTWHRLNDSQARRISALEVRSSSRQRECYLLFYVATPAGVVYATQRSGG
ncbi:hypothetical protein D9Q98_005906 [Chlorella vulgaris]|uniref:USP domain-containing protein n=1 Tax=Chlorella vulgaris TaxID=3077 RepID=A0A9D4TWP6_CHLVU|nr:hypothetical protein D9Q98_005906 [Chlorella vulgaris]